MSTSQTLTQQEQTSHTEPLSHFERFGLRAAAVTLAAIATLSTLQSSAEATPDVHPDQSSDRAAAATAAPYTIETYNILGSDHVETGHEIGGSVSKRAERAAAIILGKAGAPAADIVGMQELQRDQWKLFNRLLPNYDTAPANHVAENSIYYNTDRFTLISTDVVNHPYYGDKGIQSHNGKAITARFKDKITGQYVDVLNAHPVAWNQNPGSDAGGSQKRERTAHIIADWVEKTEQQNPDDAVHVIGDMNSTNNPRKKSNPDFMADDEAVGRNGLPYCILTEKPNELQNSRDMLLAEQDKTHKRRLGTCPDRSHSPLLDETIDWIFTDPGHTRITKWIRVDNNTSKHASDHLPVIVTAEAVNLPE